MKLYRLKHKPSGLYYKPSAWPNKGNLSIKGKIYRLKHSFNQLFNSKIYYHPIKSKYPLSSANYETRKFIEKEWEWEKLEINEKTN